MIQKDTEDISVTDIHILEAGLRWMNESRDEFSHKLYYRLLRDHPESTASLHLIDPASFNRHIIQIIEQVIDDLRSCGTIGSAHKAEWVDRAGCYKNKNLQQVYLNTTLSSHPAARQDVQKGPSSKAAGALASGAYEGIREHDKGLRTQLADFFNTLRVPYIMTRVTSEQWMGLAETFLDVLSEFAEDAWSPAIESAWRKTIHEVSIVMQKPRCESLSLAGTLSPYTIRTNFYLSRPLIFIFGILVFLTGSLASLGFWRRYRLTERKPGRTLVQKACIVVA